MNIHASLLPRWRGAAPIQRAILAGRRRNGRHDHADGGGPGYRSDAPEARRCRSSQTTQAALSMTGWPIWEQMRSLEALGSSRQWNSRSGAPAPRRRRPTRPSWRRPKPASTGPPARARSSGRSAPSIPGRSPKPAMRVSSSRVLRAKAEMEDSTRLGGQPPARFFRFRSAACWSSAAWGASPFSKCSGPGNVP